MSHIRTLIGLTAVYLALSGNFQLSNIIAGLLVGTAVILLLKPESRPVNLRALPTAVWAGIKYGINLIVDLIVSGVQVARIVLDPALPIQQGNIAIPTRCESDLAQALSAHAITITPGEMVVEMAESGVMYTHTLDASHAEEDIADAVQMRDELLKKIVP
jgi:multicomponent Na+:H+ antiporter subunit E